MKDLLKEDRKMTKHWLKNGFNLTNGANKPKELIDYDNYCYDTTESLRKKGKLKSRGFKSNEKYNYKH